MHSKQEYALTYHLEKALPRGATVCAITPKKILTKILPEAIKNKKCNLILCNPTKQALKLSTQITTKIPKADIYIIEPDYITKAGALTTPEEAQQLKSIQPIAIACTQQWKTNTPTTHDYTQVNKIITEKGTYTPEHIELTINDDAFS